MKQSNSDIKNSNEKQPKDHSMLDRLIVVVLVLSGAFLVFVFLIGSHQESLLNETIETNIENSVEEHKEVSNPKTVVSNVSTNPNVGESNQLEPMSDPGHIGYLLLTLGIVILGLCYLIKKPNDKK